MPDPIVIVEPSLEPITPVEAKDHCHIDTADTGQDALLGVFIRVAREYIEWRCGITAHEKTLELPLDCFDGPCIELPRATPLNAVLSVKYRDSAGTETTLDSSNYVTSAGSVRKLGRIALAYGMTWPSFTPYPLDAVRIRYTAGIAVTSPITEPSATIKQACGLLVAGMYENRESELITDRSAVHAHDAWSREVGEAGTACFPCADLRECCPRRMF